MITVTSKIQKTVRWDMGRFRHIVTYSADDTNPKAVVIENLEDKILELMSSDVVKAPKGTLIYKDAQIIAEDISICPRFESLVEDLKSIVIAIESGTDVKDKPFPATQ